MVYDLLFNLGNRKSMVFCLIVTEFRRRNAAKVRNGVKNLERNLWFEDDEDAKHDGCCGDLTFNVAFYVVVWWCCVGYVILICVRVRCTSTMNIEHISLCSRFVH